VFLPYLLIRRDVECICVYKQFCSVHAGMRGPWITQVV